MSLAWWAALGLATACSRAEPEAVPPAPVPPVAAHASAPPADAPAATDTAADAPDDQHQRLQPAEGTLTIGSPRRVRVGASVVTTFAVEPAGDLAINLGFPIRLALEPPPGIHVARPELTRDDASVLDDRHLILPVTWSASEPGTYAITGRLRFAVCRQTTCFPKDQPVSIDVVAEAAP